MAVYVITWEVEFPKRELDCMSYITDAKSVDDAKEQFETRKAEFVSGVAKNDVEAQLGIARVLDAELVPQGVWDKMNRMLAEAKAEAKANGRYHHSH